jgi:hypothetical protein
LAGKLSLIDLCFLLDNAVPVIGGAKIPPEVAERARQMDAIISVNGDFDFDAAERILQKVAAQ